MSLRPLKLFSNKTINDVLVVRRENVSGVLPHDVAQERLSDVS